VDPTGIDYPATILRVLLDLGHGLRRSDRLCCVGTTDDRRTHYDKQVRYQPMIGSYYEDGGTKTIGHFCGALRVAVLTMQHFR
jgi:hypothetical protein